MRQLLALSLLLTCCNCSENNAFVVKNYEYYKGDFCNYYISRPNAIRNDKLQIIDSCGKFQVGDTLILTKR